MRVNAQLNAPTWLQGFVVFPTCIFPSVKLISFQSFCQISTVHLKHYGAISIWDVVYLSSWTTLFDFMAVWPMHCVLDGVPWVEGLFQQFYKVRTFHYFVKYFRVEFWCAELNIIWTYPIYLIYRLLEYPPQTPVRELGWVMWRYDDSHQRFFPPFLKYWKIFV